MERTAGRKVVAISMPQDTYEETLRRLRANRYGSMSEYVRDLIRKDEWAERLVLEKSDPLERRRVDETTAYRWTYRQRTHGEGF